MHNSKAKVMGVLWWFMLFVLCGVNSFIVAYFGCCQRDFVIIQPMGSFIEINDTLRISQAQGFPAELIL